MPATTLAKYVGVYQLSPTAVMTISLDDRLAAQLTGQGSNPIFPESETRFFLKIVDAQIAFATDASYLVLHQNGRDLKANRNDASALIIDYLQYSTSATLAAELHKNVLRRGRSPSPVRLMS